MVNQVMRFVNDEEGATAIEYGLLAALIAAVIVTAVTAVGTALSGTFNKLLRPLLRAKRGLASRKVPGSAVLVAGHRNGTPAGDYF